MNQPTRYLVTLLAEPDSAAPEERLAQALAVLRETFRLRCLAAEQVRDDPAHGPAGHGCCQFHGLLD
jgi:hypothetical protein